MSNIREFFHTTVTDDDIGSEDVQSPDYTLVKILDGTITTFFNRIDEVATGAEETVIRVVVPPGEFYFFQKAHFTGDNVAKYTLVIDGIVKEEHRTYFSGPLNGCFDFTGFNATGLKLSEDSVIEVKVLNHRPQPGEFSARIQVVSVINIP